MPSTRKFSELRAKLEAQPGSGDMIRAAQERLEAELSAHAATLAQVRKARTMTQIQLAKALRITQPEISRIEHQTDLFLSTIRSFLEAMGGELWLVARFPEEGMVKLAVGDITSSGDEDLVPAPADASTS